MTRPLPDRPYPPRLALTIEEAALATGVAPNTFKRRVLPELRTVAIGRIRVVPTREIERWLEVHSRYDD